MNFDVCLAVCFKNLAANKTRAALTMLGIVIGVGSVITMLAIGTGASRKLQQEISNGGSNILLILGGTLERNGVNLGSDTESSLTLKDSQAISRECPAVILTAPVTSEDLQVVYGNRNWATSIHATTPEIMEIRSAHIVAGRNLTKHDLISAAKVCVLGQTVVTNLFNNVDPIGETIRIKSIPFKVIGIKEIKGQSWQGKDQDDVVFIPITTAQERLIKNVRSDSVGRISVKAASTQLVGLAERQVIDLLRQRHRIRPDEKNDFRVRNTTQMRRAATESNQIMTLLLSSIASVSLLVGGIGIMNIMLVSVTERTREVGIRLAVGATARDIRLQFLTEAVAVSLIGSIFGVVLGVVSSRLVAYFSGLPVEISLWSVFLSVGVAGLIGIFFGYYPAFQASILTPIEALRCD